MKSLNLKLLRYLPSLLVAILFNRKQAVNTLSLYLTLYLTKILCHGIYRLSYRLCIYFPAFFMYGSSPCSLVAFMTTEILHSKLTLLQVVRLPLLLFTLIYFLQSNFYFCGNTGDFQVHHHRFSLQNVPATNYPYPSINNQHYHLFSSRSSSSSSSFPKYLPSSGTVWALNRLSWPQSEVF